MPDQARQYPPLDVRLFFGDGDYDFKLTISAISALQVKCQSGIGQIYTRVISGQFYSQDLLETVRHGLIGGGMAPKPAHDLIESYSDVVPLEDWQDIATAVLAAATHGYKSDEGGEETRKKP